MIIDAKSAFNILADGSDETTKINAAFAAAGGVEAGELLYFGPGIYGCDGLDQLTGVRNFIGAGMRKTTFKNLSPNVRLFDFQPGNGPSDWGSSFMRGERFSIDQNGCSAPAIKLNVQQNGLRDVWVKNQGGGRNGSYAVECKNATHANLDNVHMLNCDNGLKLDTCYYVSGRNITIERQKGRALYAVNCAETTIGDMYIDNGNPAAIGNTVPEMMLVQSCGNFSIGTLSTEIATAGTLDFNITFANGERERAYILYDSAEAFQIGSFRVNHSAVDSGNAYIFYAKDSFGTVSNTEWYENQNSKTLFGCFPGNHMLAVENVITRNTATSGRYGVGAWNGKSKMVSVKRWRNVNNACEVYIQAEDIVCEQVQAPINLYSTDVGKRYFVNCQSITGPGAAGSSCINTPVI